MILYYRGGGLLVASSNDRTYSYIESVETVLTAARVPYMIAVA